MSLWGFRANKKAMTEIEAPTINRPETPPPPQPPLSLAVNFVESGRRLSPKAKTTSLPPHDGPAEQAVLGSMMIEVEAIQVASQYLKREAFYYEHHRAIFEAILSLTERGIASDLVLVGVELRSKGKINQIGGMAYLAELQHNTATAAHVNHYSKVVAGLYLEREIIATCHKYSSSQEQQHLDRLRELHLERESLSTPFMFNYPKDMPMVMDQILAEKDKEIYNTHIRALDVDWHGMKPGEINVWGAATNRGKSVFMLNMMHRAALNKTPCLYIGTEMSSIETIKRHLALASGVEAWRVRKPDLDDRQQSKLRSIIESRLKNMPITILDDPEPSLSTIEAAIHYSKAKRVFLDYLERFDMPNAESLRLQIKAFMKKLTTIARRMEVVVDLACQLNRDTYGAEERTPMLSDLSESSAIEKEASRVTLLWTPTNKEKYNASQITLPEKKRYIQAINRKNRHGSTGLTYEFVLDEVTLKVLELSEYNDSFNHPA